MTDKTHTTLAHLRAARGLSLRKWAAEVGISPSYAHQLDTGERPPSLNVLRRLVHVYQLTDRPDVVGWVVIGGEPPARLAELLEVAA